MANAKDVFGLDTTHLSLLDFDTKIAQNAEPIYERIEDAARYSSSR